jgi:hypothetical protein
MRTYKAHFNPVRHWVGNWKIDNANSHWNNSIILLIRNRYNTLRQRNKEDVQIWKIKVNLTDTRKCIFTILKNNGRMKIYRGEMNLKHDTISWTDYNTNKIVDKWVRYKESI